VAYCFLFLYLGYCSTSIYSIERIAFCGLVDTSSWRFLLDHFAW
jgi:hypothetical protein